MSIPSLDDTRMFDHDSNFNMQNSAMNMAEQPPFLAISIMRQQWTTTCSLLFVELIRVHREYHGERICEIETHGVGVLDQRRCCRCHDKGRRRP